MIQRIGAGVVNYNKYLNVKNTTPAEKNSVTLPSFSGNYTATGLVNAYQAFHGITPAKTVSFGASLSEKLEKFKRSMYVCKDKASERSGELVGERVPVTDVIKNFSRDLIQFDDAIKTNIPIDFTPGKYVDARTQLKKTDHGILYNMNVHQPRTNPKERADNNIILKDKIDIEQDVYKSTEKAYVLKDKSNKLMVAVEDGNNVILTNEGKFAKKSGNLSVTMQKLNPETGKLDIRYNPFVKPTIEVQPIKKGKSIGEGTELIIGLEEGRFVSEIIDSIEQFVKKVDKGDIVLPQFIAEPDAKNIQLAMLAGGFGSRAEYTNASSSAIMHGKNDGTQSTKGIFKTATGFTPMETTFITLHKAGLLDCSKGKLKIGDNIKFYLNRSKKNDGNGDFTVGIYDQMTRPGRESMAIFPNDSMSRMPLATVEMAKRINSGEASVAMIAKKVKSQDAINTFGIMKIDPNTKEILDFDEKPPYIKEGYADNDGMCLTNTFQFAISKEAFKAISLIEPYIPIFGKESRDWSKSFIPILMNLSKYSDPKDVQKGLGETIGKEAAKKNVEFKGTEVPESKILEAKAILGNQKVYAVPTSESWSDVGNLNALYDTTMKIATNEFKLEDFERKHVLDSINTDTGLVTSSPQQKEQIEREYEVSGQVMVAPQAKKPRKEILDEYIQNNWISIKLPKNQ
jgi:hypothetical protein